MKQETARRSLALFILLGCAIAALSRAEQPPTTPAAQPPAAAQDTGASGSSVAPTPSAAPNGTAATSASQQSGLSKIVQLSVAPSGEPASENIALNDKLAIELSQTPSRPADQYVLFLNGNEMKGLAPAIYATLKNKRHALVFKLTRNKENDAFWKELLGSPKRFTIPVTVGLGERTDPCSPSQPCKSPTAAITGDSTSGSFEFELLSWPWLALASFGVAIVLFLVWGHARTRATIRDNLLPQLPPNLQPYSLARWQMSFWFVLIFASFLFLYILLWDYNTVSNQALALMGISAATGLAAVAVDVYKDSPADAVNRGLQALGLHNYDDVVRIKQELDDREAELAIKKQAFDREPPVAPAQAGQAPPLPSPTAQRITQLQLEIQDRQNILRLYESQTRNFVTQGWFKDITTDLNGTAIHRLQVVCWTVVLGLVFIVGVYRDLAMPPDFSATLLALMGISSAGYVGFKFPEKNN